MATKNSIRYRYWWCLQCSVSLNSTLAACDSLTISYLFFSIWQFQAAGSGFVLGLSPSVAAAFGSLFWTHESAVAFSSSQLVCFQILLAGFKAEQPAYYICIAAVDLLPTCHPFLPGILFARIEAISVYLPFPPLAHAGLKLQSWLHVPAFFLRCCSCRIFLPFLRMAWSISKHCLLNLVFSSASCFIWRRQYADLGSSTCSRRFFWGWFFFSVPASSRRLIALNKVSCTTISQLLASLFSFVFTLIFSILL